MLCWYVVLAFRSEHFYVHTSTSWLLLHWQFWSYWRLICTSATVGSMCERRLLYSNESISRARNGVIIPSCHHAHNEISTFLLYSLASHWIWVGFVCLVCFFFQEKIGGFISHSYLVAGLTGFEWLLMFIVGFVFAPARNSGEIERVSWISEMNWAGSGGVLARWCMI